MYEIIFLFYFVSIKHSLVNNMVEDGVDNLLLSTVENLDQDPGVPIAMGQRLCSIMVLRQVGQYISDISDWFPVFDWAKGVWQPAV